MVGNYLMVDPQNNEPTNAMIATTVVFMLLLALLNGGI